MSIHEAAIYRASPQQSFREQGYDDKLLFENAFDDMTDFQ